MPVVSPVHKGIGLTFTVLGIFEQAEAGYLIKYRIVPTWPTILRFSVYFILVLPLLFSNLNEGHKLAIWFAFLGSVILIVLSFIKHHQQCEQFFLKLFEKATTSKQERV